MNQPHPSFPIRPSQPEIHPGLICRMCGMAPAAAVSFRTHLAAVFFLSHRTEPGPFCRRCATALFRTLTTASLAGGWWSLPSLLVLNPFVIIANLRALRETNQLPEPPPLPWPPLYRGKPLHCGKPVRHRPAAYIALVPALWALWCIVGGLIYALLT